MQKPVCIIGAGWYGCSTAMFCLKNKIPFILFEKESDIFTKSSYYNQCRLHQGFHYARSSKTRILCKKGYDKFLKEYPQLALDFKDNYYAVADDSLLDGDTYCIIMDSLHLNYKRILNKSYLPFDNIQTILKTKEQFIDNKKAKTYFKKKLNKYLHYNHEINNQFIHINKNKFSYFINCTNNTFNKNDDFYYELTLSVLYNKIKNTEKIESLTIVDGQFSSLYPFDIDDNIYTLTHVKYTPLTKSNNYQDIVKFQNNLNNFDIKNRINLIENDFIKYYPEFKEYFEYNSFFIALKSKPRSKCDERDCYITRKNNVIDVVCGKITGIFEFEEYLKKLFL
jgi:hypothetical protein